MYNGQGAKETHRVDARGARISVSMGPPSRTGGRQRQASNKNPQGPCKWGTATISNAGNSYRGSGSSGAVTFWRSIRKNSYKECKGGCPWSLFFCRNWKRVAAALICPASFRLLMQSINWARRTCEADDAWENCSTDAAQVSTPPPERGVMALEVLSQQSYA